MRQAECQTVRLLMGGVLVACTSAAGPTSRPAWQTTPQGSLILRPFENAPYPHASRENGFTNSGGKHWDKAGHYDDSTVAVFVPAGYVPRDSVNYVVHFHGHGNSAANAVRQYRLPEQLVASGANAILLVPQGPKDAGDSGCGKLELDKDGFARLIDEVARYLRAEGKIKTDRVGRITLSAHSGGYKVVASILDHGGLADRIGDVCLLDASYGNLDWFAAWCAASPEHRLVSFYTEHLADENKLLQGMLEKAGVKWRTLDEAEIGAGTFSPRGVTFVPTKLKHDDVPVGKEYFRRVIEGSRWE